MKPALLALSFLLFAFPLAFSNDVPQPVLDVDGDAVVTGSDYFVRPLTGRIPPPPLPGVLTLGQTGNSTCAATVEAVYPPFPFPAFSLKFTPAGAGVNANVIFTDTPLEIAFTSSYVESPKWVVFVDTDINQTYVGIGGPEDHGGQQAFSGTFKILKDTTPPTDPYTYNLAFCLPIIVDGSPVCWNIEPYLIEGPSGFEIYLLVLTNNKPDFKFKLHKPNPPSQLRLSE